MNTGNYKLSEEDYHADKILSVPTLSRSVIHDLIYRCPSVAWRNHPRLNPNFTPKEKKAFDIGKAAHSLLLEGIDSVGIVDAKDWRTNAAKEAGDNFRKAGKIPMLNEQAKGIRDMEETASVYLEMLEIPGVDRLGINLQADGMPEQTWVAEINGTAVRCRTDWIKNDGTLILDYKTTAKLANPDDFASTVISSGLDIQAAFYTRIVESVHGTRPKFIFVVQEIEEPYLCASFYLDEMFIDMGNEKVDTGIKLWKDCLSTNKWPGYSSELYRMEPKPWFLSDWEHRKFMLTSQSNY